MTELPPEWTFDSTVTDPGGVRVTTTITVPADAAWADVRECGELAQMGSHVTVGHVMKSRTSSNERNEVQF